MIEKSNQTAKNKNYKKACHRSWAKGNALVPGGHRGDIMSKEERSKLMSRIRDKNTAPERIMFELTKQLGIPFKKHVSNLPGKPDIVFKHKKVIVFIDGDFWHGWRFPLWKHKLSEKWQIKIQATRNRDQVNFRKLRQLGWKVLRIWEHQIEQNPKKCMTRIVKLLEI